MKTKRKTEGKRKYINVWKGGREDEGDKNEERTKGYKVRGYISHNLPLSFLVVSPYYVLIKHIAYVYTFVT